MTDVSWPPVPLRSTLGDWAGRTIAAGGLGDLGRRTTAVLAISRVRRDGQVRVTYTDLAHEKLDPPSQVLLPADLTVSEAVLGLSHVRPVRAGVPPKVTGLKRGSRRSAALFIGAASVVLLVASVLAQSGYLLLMAFIMGLSAVLGVYGRSLFEAGLKPRVFDGYDEILASDVYGRLEADQSVADPSLLSPGSRVDLVTERYGALRDDIVYRIENSALFDTAVAETQRFKLALLAWDAASPDAASLATEVEAAFDEARRHAEELGLDHLPETARDSGRRAARAAHSALNAGTEGEREAARLRVADILRSLALYYLPTVDPAAPGLIGRRKEIEPR